MNTRDSKYDFALVREMLETPQIVGEFDFHAACETAEVIRQTGKLFLTGEGSSRIFPAKNLMCEILRHGIPLAVATEGARQAHEYDLSQYAVFGASNSGKTKELISLFTKLAKQGHAKRFGLTANSPVRAGERPRIAATRYAAARRTPWPRPRASSSRRSFYRSLLGEWASDSPLVAARQRAAEQTQKVLETELDPAIVERIAKAPVVLFCRPKQRRGRKS